MMDKDKKIESIGRLEVVNSIMMALECEIKLAELNANEKAYNLLREARLELIKVGIKVRDARGWMLSDPEVQRRPSQPKC
jgi:hypothetical protein